MRAPSLIDVLPILAPYLPSMDVRSLMLVNRRFHISIKRSNNSFLSRFAVNLKISKVFNWRLIHVFYSDEFGQKTICCTFEDDKTSVVCVHEAEDEKPRIDTVLAEKTRNILLHDWSNIHISSTGVMEMKSRRSSNDALKILAILSKTFDYSCLKLQFELNEEEKEWTKTIETIRQGGAHVKQIQLSGYVEPALALKISRLLKPELVSLPFNRLGPKNLNIADQLLIHTLDHEFEFGFEFFVKIQSVLKLIQKWQASDLPMKSMDLTVYGHHNMEKLLRAKFEIEMWSCSIGTDYFVQRQSDGAVVRITVFAYEPMDIGEEDEDDQTTSIMLATVSV